MTATLLRLAFAGIKSRTLASILTVALTVAAAATIVIALEVGSTLSEPWLRTFNAAHGAHALANLSSEVDARTFARLPGVAESDNPVPVVTATMMIDGKEERVFLAGLDGPARINMPILTEGSTVTDGGIVIERSFAESFNLPVGTTLEFVGPNGAINLTAVGTAISPSQPRFPRRNPGLVWVARSDFERIVPDQSRWRWEQAVRLDNPAGAPAFIARALATFPPGTANIESWQDQQASAEQDAQPFQLILTVYALLLLGVSVSVIAILIGARVSGQHREIGLLKAIGLTPRQVNAVFVIETTALGVVGVVIGFLTGVLVAPRLVATGSATLLGSPTVAANGWHMIIAAVVILPVIMVSAYVSARRSTRATVLQAIRTGASACQSRLARLVYNLGLPIALALGLRDVIARRSRAFWLVCAIAVTGSAMVVTLSVQAAFDNRAEGVPSDVPGELPALIFTLDAVLAVMTLSALIAVALLSVRERIRDFGVLRTIGLTPNEVTTSLTGTHAAIALVGSVLSIPIGIGLFLALYAAASDDGSGATSAPWWLLAAVPVVMTVITVLVTILPARLAAHIPTAEAVRYE